MCVCVCSSFYTELFLKVVADIGYEYLTFDLFLRFQIPGTRTSIFGGCKPSRMSWRLEGNVIYTRNASRWLQKSPAGVNKRGKSWRDRRARRMMRKLWYINRFGDYALRSQLLPRKFAIRTCLSDTSNEFPYRILNGRILLRNISRCMCVPTIKVSNEWLGFSVHDSKQYIATLQEM